MARGGARHWTLSSIIVVVGVIGLSMAGRAASQSANEERYGAVAEFHLARLGYPTYAYANFRGFAYNPMWRVDFPDAEWNFLPALSRLTSISGELSADLDLRESADRLHLEALDEHIFKYPFLFTQQPGGAGWRPSKREAEVLREYLARGGFLLIDDFHGSRDFNVVASALKQILPDRGIIEIPGNGSLMHVLFDLDDRLQIPGRRHLRSFGGGIDAQMSGPPYWLGIYDEFDRLMVGINYNIDMGDAWEHADDPYYLEPMTGQAYRL